MVPNLATLVLYYKVVWLLMQAYCLIFINHNSKILYNLNVNGMCCI